MFIRLFTIFDGRIGKDRYKEVEDILVGDTEWLHLFYEFRYQAENKYLSY